VTGNAIRLAAEDAKAILFEVAAGVLAAIKAKHGEGQRQIPT
jgi:hypothetical protein